MRNNFPLKTLAVVKCLKARVRKMGDKKKKRLTFADDFTRTVSLHELLRSLSH